MADQGADSGQKSGPFGIQGDRWEWYLYIKDGATPTATELELANRVGTLGDTMREFSRTSVAEDLMGDLHRLASATLVQAVNVDLKKYVDDVGDLEKDFFRRVVTRAHKERMIRPTVVTFIAFSIAIVLAFVVPALDARWGDIDLSWGDTISFVVAGTLFGRLLYFAAAFGEPITSITQYQAVAGASGTIVLSVFFDVVIGVAACLAFISGLLIVAVGATEADPTSGISSLTIDSNALNALVFGMIVGFAKTEFLKKFKDVSSKAMQ